MECLLSKYYDGWNSTDFRKIPHPVIYLVVIFYSVITSAVKFHMNLIRMAKMRVSIMDSTVMCPHCWAISKTFTQCNTYILIRVRPFLGSGLMFISSASWTRRCLHFENWTMATHGSVSEQVDQNCSMLAGYCANVHCQMYAFPWFKFQKEGFFVFTSMGSST